jgi:uncharacterized protein YkwD
MKILTARYLRAGAVALGLSLAVMCSMCGGSTSTPLATDDAAARASSGSSSGSGSSTGGSSSGGSSSGGSPDSGPSDGGPLDGSSPDGAPSDGASPGDGSHDAGPSDGASSESGSSGGSSSSSGGGDGSTDASNAADAPDGCPASTPADALSFQQYDVSILNAYRATLSLPPYTLDSQLSTFSLAASQELSTDHQPHQYFIDAGSGLWTMGFNTSAGENQGDPNGWTVLSSCATTDEDDQITQILQAMFDEGPGTGEAHGHYENIMSATFTRVGVGLVEVSGRLYLTHDFSN